MKKLLRVGLLGADGRMGREIREILEQPDYRRHFQLAATPKRGEPLDPLLDCDVAIEFASPGAALELAEKASESGRKVPLVVGSTGWSHDEEMRLEAIAASYPILYAANFSLGIVMAKASLAFWSKWPGTEDWKVSIREIHHSGKKDAPSGTALSLADSIAKASGRFAPIDSVREGDVIGVHEVVFESASEKLALRHEAKTRAVFAIGALESATRFEEKFRTRALPPRLIGLEDLYTFARE